MKISIEITFTIALLAAGGPSLGGCSVSKDTSQPSTDAPIMENDSGDRNPALQSLGCGYPAHAYGDFCHEVEIRGKGKYRYLFFPAQNPAPSAIFDPGGPGVSPFSDYVLTDSIKELHDRGFSVLILDEPWVTNEHPNSCLEGMKQFYSNIRANYPELGSEGNESSLVESCVEPHSVVAAPSVYAEVISRIESKHSTKIEYFTGHSFASVRASYLSKTHPDMKVRVANPFPLGADAATFFEESWNRRKELFFSKCPECAGLPQSFELDSAIAQGLPPDNNSKSAIQHASDSYWQVLSGNQISISRVGYLTEICNSLTGWEKFKDGNGAGILMPQHRYCTSQPIANDYDSTLPVDTCFAVSDGDPVAPWFSSTATDSVTIVNVDSQAHDSISPLSLERMCSSL